MSSNILRIIKMINIYAARWYEAIFIRRSRRKYDINKLVEPHKLEILINICQNFRPFPSARATLFEDKNQIAFLGIIGSYGKISGVQNCIAFIGDMRDPFVQEKTGYLGEAIILEATSLGLNTCWVGGFFNPNKVSQLIHLKENEKIIAITPVGYAIQQQDWQELLFSGFGINHKRLPTGKIVEGLSFTQTQPWIEKAIIAARLAPSAINRQPWLFHISNDKITVKIRTQGPDFNVSKRLDCGIAMLHLDIVATLNKIRGNWKFLPSPFVAEYKFS